MLKKYLTTKLIIVWSTVIIILGGSIFWFTRPDQASDTVKVVKGTITQEVVITGKTESSENIEMSFDRAGRVSSAPVKVGDRVTIGQTLASLDSGDLYAQLEQALANVKAKEAKLSELRKSTLSGNQNTPSSELLGAENDLRNARTALVQSLTDAYTKNDDAVRNLTDIFFDNPRTTNAYYNLDGVTSDELIDLSFSRRDLEERLVAWNARISVLSATSDLEKEYNLDLANLVKTRVYLDKISQAINAQTPDSDITASVLSGYRSNVSSARAQINLAVSNLQAARQAVLVAQNKLDLTVSTPEELSIGESEVEQAQAQVSQIKAQISKNMIIAPISGLVTRQDAKVGETATPGVNVVTVMSDGSFEITANVPEVDVGKLALGNKVTITLDAYAGEVWDGSVTYIEPAETVVDGVVNYKIKVGFGKNDTRLKSGLTANLTIETVRKDNVLILPQYSIIENDKGSFVEKNIGNNKTEQVAVKIGIRSQDGRVEILSGVAEGDEVLNVGLKK